MGRIQVLQPYIANQIAAGEVVDRPASVVKELVENAIDAGATAISVEIVNGGIDRIRIADNGVGIPAEDVLIAFDRHATSKISSAEDLEAIETLGFRGEALCSIAAVSQVELKTKALAEEIGSLVRMEGGECKLQKPAAVSQGTVIIVDNLFYNVPARRKFLKSARAEAGAIGEHMARLILARPDIAIQYHSNGKCIYQSSGDSVLKNAIYTIYGKDVLDQLLPVRLDNGYIAIEGFIGTTELCRPNRKDQTFLLNGRVFRSSALHNALQRAYATRLMGGKFPFAVLSIKISAREIDVNVHPAKLEVRFAQEGRVYAAVVDACALALGPSVVPIMRLPEYTKPMPQISQARQMPNEEKDAPVGKMADSSEAILPFRHLENQTIKSSFSVKESTFDIPHFHVGASAVLNSAQTAQHMEEPPADTVQSPIPVMNATLDTESGANQAETQLTFSEEPFSILGCAYQTYWIIQQGESIYFIDQHAAHERSVYERLMANRSAPASQLLLVPELLQLTASELALLQENSDAIAVLGFSMEPFGPTTMRITAVPPALIGTPAGDILRDALELLRRQSSVSVDDLRQEAIIQTACKHAIKAHDTLTEEEIRVLLAYFQEQGTPRTCPHGRPVMFRLSRRELEKMFHRIV